MEYQNISTAEKKALIVKLWESLDEPDVAYPSWQLEDAKKRLENRGNQPLRNWEEVKSKKFNN